MKHFYIFILLVLFERSYIILNILCVFLYFYWYDGDYDEGVSSQIYARYKLYCNVSQLSHVETTFFCLLLDAALTQCRRNSIRLLQILCISGKVWENCSNCVGMAWLNIAFELRLWGFFVWMIDYWENSRTKKGFDTKTCNLNSGIWSK